MTATQIHELAANSLDRAKLFVVLGLEGCALAIPQNEVRALEPVLDVRPLTKPAPNAAGFLSLDGRQCLVYALDSDFKCLATIPSQHRICAILSHRDESYALACVEVRMLPRSALATHEIPRALANQKSPVRALVVSNNQLLLGTTSSAIFAHVSQLNAEVIPFDEHSRRPRP